LKAERFVAIGVFHCRQYTKKFAAEKRNQMHFLSKEHNVEMIHAYVQRESGVSRKGVVDKQTATKQKQEYIIMAENGGLKSKEHQKISK
jgi:adenylate kinase